MADTDEKIMQFVAGELKKKPSASTSELFEKAKAKDAAIGKLSIRQFHARYPLQVKRRQSLAKQQASGGRARAGARKKSGAPRGRAAATRRHEEVRKVLLGFASDLSAAEQRKDLVKVLAQVDDYVDRTISAARGR